VNTFARLRGSFTPQQWDPHTGAISAPQYTQVTEAGTPITRVALNVTTLHSVFITSAYTTSAAGPGHAGEVPRKARLSVFQSFKNGMVISYSVPQENRDLVSVNMQVFDIKGARIATLLDRQEKAGTYTTTWDARRAPAGTYIVRLRVDGRIGIMRKVTKD
jgi:hypothetical protein